MALTDQQKHRVVFLLGWSGLTLKTGSTQYNSVVNDRLTDLNTEIERIVIGLLERLEALDLKLDAASCRLSASEIQDIVLNPEEIRMLNKERKRLIRELSDHLDIPIEKSGGVNIGVVC
jgi:hypothetical protein